MLLPPASSENTVAARVAVLVPCYNEAETVGGVVHGLRAALPDAAIYVFDNDSTDGTADVALAAGATVIREPRRGKGHVVQSMFRKVEADVYLMIDGDGTYPTDAAERLVAPVLRGEADMVIGSRLHRDARSEFRPLNRLGNRFFRSLLTLLFGRHVGDLFSGYRAFGRNLVRGVPLFGGGFETETEMTIKALHRGFRILELPVDLAPRPAGSFSKLRIVHDGLVILRTMLALARDYKPLTLFGAAGLMALAASIPAWASAAGAAQEAPWPAGLPSVAVAVTLTAVGASFVVTGLVLHTVARHFQELDLHLQIVVDEVEKRASRDSTPSAERGT